MAIQETLDTYANPHGNRQGSHLYVGDAKMGALDTSSYKLGEITTLAPWLR